MGRIPRRLVESSFLWVGVFHSIWLGWKVCAALLDFDAGPGCRLEAAPRDVLVIQSYPRVRANVCFQQWDYFNFWLYFLKSDSVATWPTGVAAHFVPAFSILIVSLFHLRFSESLVETQA